MSLSRSLFTTGPGLTGSALGAGATATAAGSTGASAGGAAALSMIGTSGSRGGTAGLIVAAAADAVSWVRLEAARCRGEFLSASRAFESAPHSKRSRKTSVLGKELSVWFLMIEEESRDEARWRREDILLFFGSSLTSS